MKKFETKVNMYSIRIIFLILIVLLIGATSVFALPDRGNSVRMEYSNELDGGGTSIIKEFFSIFFGPGSGNSQNNSSNTNNSNSSNNSNNRNSSTQNVTDPNALSPEQLASYPTPQTVNGFKIYRQCNYRNISTIKGCTNSGTLCSMGCGITSAAMILSTILKQNIDPVTLLKKYKDMKAYIGCDGTNADDAKKVIQGYGLQTSGYLFNYGHSNAATIGQVAPDIREKVKNGWYVFALTDFCKDGCSHYFVITDIDANNVVTSYDPYYETPENSKLPINYTNRYPFPKYRTAFAVKIK